MSQGLSDPRPPDDAPRAELPGVTHAVPLDQPGSVAQIVQRLFPAYQVEGGRVHLAGCTLEERLFLRLRCRFNGHVVDLYSDAEGNQLEPESVGTLGLDSIRPAAGPSPGGAAMLSRFLDCFLPRLQERFPAGAELTLCSAMAVWCKFVQGKLRFSIGEHSTDLAFSGWARSLRPPPYVCPHTGQETFRLGLTDDGRIAAAEQIACCAETGRRALLNETVVCSATGKRVMAELAQKCPVTGEAVLTTAMVPCGMCGQLVSPRCVKRDRCAACRAMRLVSKADPRMARLLHEHPDFDRWGGWRIVETSAVYVLTASGWLRRLLVVVDKESLEIRLLGTGMRFSHDWELVRPEQYAFVLRE